MSLRGKGCIAIKLREARNKGSKTPRGKEQRLHDSAGQRTKAPLLRGAKNEGKFALQFHGDFVLCPAELWGLRSLPRVVMEQCNLCPANSQRHSFRGKSNHKHYLKIWVEFF